jgi:hypothetical protein
MERDNEGRAESSQDINLFVNKVVVMFFERNHFDCISVLCLVFNPSIDNRCRPGSSEVVYLSQVAMGHTQSRFVRESHKRS